MRSPIAFALASCLIASAAVAYTEAPVTAGGSISGKITYAAKPPAKKTVPITKDPKVCGASRDDDAWLIDAAGGVRNVVVYLADVQSGKKNDAELKPVLDQQGCHYVPHVSVVPLGAELQVKSGDPILHNVHSFLNGSTVINFAMPPIPSTSKPLVLTKKLNKAGGMQLKCDVHNFMRGGIFVTENPYWALTGADGSFEIKEIPPGTYKIATWHEEGGPLSESVTVPPSGKVTWNGKVR